MTGTVLVCGYGPGISEAVARKFGDAGFSVALVARSADRVEAGARALGEAGVKAHGFSCDLSDLAAIRALVADVREKLGPIAVIHWNAYAGLAGDLTTCDVEDLRTVLDVGVHGMVVAVQEALPDLRAAKDPAVLVTGGGFAFYEPEVDSMIVQWNAMGLSIAKAAQHKLVGVLHEKLKGEGIYVGEAVVLGVVKGTAFDSGYGTIEPAHVADAFFALYQERSQVSVRVPS
ncbi:MAG: SDR family NAD(P)-dependent oxidoreductase [Myxococcales bacterium]|nr:SDR family NAD(P)-dependent oxidoreductase [Myxococcales bacterium]